MTALPVAPILKVIAPDRRGEAWRIVVACPFCFVGRGRRRRPGHHGHGIGPGPDAAPLGSRVSDCQPGGVYEIGPLPAERA